MGREPKTGEFYRQNKGGLCQIVNVATDVDTNDRFVIYQELSGNYGIYTRRVDIFMENAKKQIINQNESEQEEYPQNPNENDFKEVDNLGEKLNIGGNLHSDDMFAPNPKLIEFLDADSYEDKYNVLVSMENEITDRLVDDMAVVLDLVIPEGDVMNRYDQLKYAVRTKGKYEYNDRFR